MTAFFSVTFFFLFCFYNFQSSKDENYRVSLMKSRMFLSKTSMLTKKAVTRFVCLFVCLLLFLFFFPIISLGEFLFVCLFVSYCKVQVQRTRLKFWIPDKICPSNRYKNNEFSCKQSKSDQESLRRNKYGTLQSHLYSQFSFVQPSFKKSLGK